MSRVGEFATGVTGPSETPSLMNSSAAINSLVPKGFKANGLNQPFMLDSSNGNSKRDAMRQTPQGQLPSMNGMAEDTYQTIVPTAFGTNLGI